MTYGVVATFSPGGYDLYGKRMIETFAKYWPEDIPLRIYYEGDNPPADASARAIWMPLDADKDRQKFMAEHIDTDPKDYKKCPVRYSHKVWAMTGCPRDTDHLIFLDADIEAFAPVSHAAIKGFCADVGQVGSFLARPYFRHTETGFLSFRMDNRGGDFLDAFRKVYTSGDLFKLPELHDCMAYDSVRKKFERAGHRFKNICPQARSINVFGQSALKDYMHHRKGPEAKFKHYGAAMSAAGEEA